MIKKVSLAFVVIIIAIQFIKPQRNSSPAIAQPNAISTKYLVPAEVAQILKVSCNDCHSNNTKYPWYNNIQPVAWWLNDHIKEGKRKFNLDEFTTYSLKRQDHKLEELVESQADHWMPMESYTWTHKEALLTNKQSKLLVDWANSTRKQIQGNPEFALLKK
jgi:hypothetical protein